MKTLAESRLQSKFDPARLTGDAEMTFEMFRPALDDVPYEQVRFSVLGTVTNGGLKEAALGFDLTNGKFNINGNQAGITVSGFGDLGPSPVQFTWRDAFNDGDAPSNLSATAVVTPDVLNRFGMLGRAYLTGEVPLEVQARLNDENLVSADTSLDLGEARIDLSEIGWVKPKGVPAKASVRYEKLGDNTKSTILFTTEWRIFAWAGLKARFGDTAAGLSQEQGRSERRRRPGCRWRIGSLAEGHLSRPLRRHVRPGSRGGHGQ